MIYELLTLSFIYEVNSVKYRRGMIEKLRIVFEFELNFFRSFEVPDLSLVDLSLGDIPVGEDVQVK